MRELTEWSRATRFPDRPWLILGKGPTFARRHEFDLTRYNLLSLNHAVTEEPVDVAHVVDLDVVEECGAALIENCRWVVMPRHPHLMFRATQARLEDFMSASPWLRELDEQDRLVWYNAGSGVAEPGSPVIDLLCFSSEAALGILATMGATTVRSLGVDGGGSYSAEFAGLGERTLLQNQQPSFNSQFAELDRIAAQHDVDFRPLISPLRVFIGGDVTQRIPARVLEHSIQEHASAPVRVDVLDQELPRLPRDERNRPRTPFSFNRFRIPELMGYEGPALYLDSDMQVFGDVGEVFELPFGPNIVLCTRQDEPPAQWRDHPDFKAGRQFSVMLIDCARAQWSIDEIVDDLDAGRYSYEQLMFDLAVVPPDRIGEDIPVEWNHLERFEPGATKNLHYTVVPTQPWRVEGNPLQDVWLEAYRRAVEANAVHPRDVEDAVRRAWVRPALAELAAESQPRSPSRALEPIEIELGAARDRIVHLGNRDTELVEEIVELKRQLAALRLQTAPLWRRCARRLRAMTASISGARALRPGDR